MLIAKSIANFVIMTSFLVEMCILSCQTTFPTSPPMAHGGEDELNTKFWKSEIKDNLNFFRCIRGFFEKSK
jgi:hypothetical protein